MLSDINYLFMVGVYYFFSDRCHHATGNYS